MMTNLSKLFIANKRAHIESYEKDGRQPHCLNIRFLSPCDEDLFDSIKDFGNDCIEVSSLDPEKRQQLQLMFRKPLDSNAAIAAIVKDLQEHGYDVELERMQVTRGIARVKT